jgi:hypothetical protein
VWLPWLCEWPFAELVELVELELDVDELDESLVDDLVPLSLELPDDEVLDEPSEDADDAEPDEPELDPDELVDDPLRLSVL